MNPKEQLIAFLYLLMRDSVVVGEVHRLVGEVEQGAGKQMVYSSPGLEQVARAVADRLLQ